MLKQMTTIALMFGLAAAIAAAPRQDREEHHDNGKHRGQDHRGEDRDDGDRHDNGKHKGWYKQQSRDDYRDWDYDHDRIRPGKHYPYGRYDHVRRVYIARTFDPRARRIVLYDRSNWVVATYDVPRCRDWEWDRDQVYVYDDDHHPGWYVLFNSRLGRSVHVEFSGVR
jgi:hypothetical protein